MTLANSTIGLIRSFFNQSRGIAQPESMSNLVWNSMYQMGGGVSGGVAPMAEGNQSLQNALNINTDLLSRYADFQDMSSYPECFTSLNTWADEATQEHVIENRSVWFETDNEQIKNILDFTFNRQLKIEDQLWQIARNIAKYGNAFKEIVVQDGVGVVKLIGRKSQYVRRIQDEQGNLFGYLEDPTMSFKMTTDDFLKRLYYGSEHITQPSHGQTVKDSYKIYEPWEICHWRLQSDDADELYGISMLEAARWAWKRLQMMEDALVVGKLTKASQRYVYYVDVGDVPPNEARKILNTVKQEFSKQKMVDSNGKISWKYNPMCLDLQTKIPLLNGITKTLNELIIDHENGIKNYVYSINREKALVVPGEIQWAGITRRNAQVVRVTLDNGESVICTPDHKFVSRKGYYTEAKDLMIGQSLMPFTKGINKGREWVYQPAWSAQKTTAQSTHKMVANHYLGEDSNKEVHHKDRVKLNNYPYNLSLLTEAEHKKEHAQERADQIKAWTQTEQHSKNAIYWNKKLCKIRCCRP